MNKNPSWRSCKISSCSLNESTIIFKELHYNVYQMLYKDMPENTIGEKIHKLRAMHHLERNELAKLIGCHIDTVENWENENVPPKIYNIEKLCNLFDVQAEYFHAYYSILKTDYVKRILTYKNTNGLNYQQLGLLLGISESTIKRIINKKLILSLKLFYKLKDNFII